MGKILDMGGFPIPGVPSIVNPRTGAPFGLNSRVDNVTAAFGDETTLVFAAPIYQDAIQIIRRRSGVSLYLLRDVDFTLNASKTRATLTLAATVNDIYSVNYWTAAPNPAATTLPAAGAVPVSFDPAHKNSNMTLSNSNYNAQNTGGSGYISALCTGYLNTGKRYLEIEKTQAAATNTFCGGLGTSSANLAVYPGYSTGTFGCQCDVSGSTVYFIKDNVQSTTTSISPITMSGINKRLAIAVDFDAGKLWFGTNGSWAYGGDPAAGTSPTYTFTPNLSLTVMGGCGPGETSKLHTGQDSMVFTVPSGYVSGFKA